MPSNAYRQSVIPTADIDPGQVSVQPAAGRITPWRESYQQLHAFHCQHGHCRIPHPGRDSRYARLYSWLSYQRRLYKSGKLSEEYQDLLMSLGVELKQCNYHDQRWHTRFEELRRFRLKHGHADVPTNFAENQKLAAWCMTQRQLYWHGRLQAERRAQLDRIGFRYQHRNERNQDQWERRFQELQAYHAAHGSSHISTLSRDNASLARWVSDQRSKYHIKELSTDRIARLNSLDFAWSLPDERWQAKYEQALHYQRRYGHLQIPAQVLEYQSLAEWLKRQRQLYKQRRLPRQRRIALEALGFSLSPHKQAWEQMYQRLCDYRQARGSCAVISSKAGIKGLGDWVRRQRKAYKRGDLSSERIAKLEAIGFSWDGKRGRPAKSA